MNRSPTRSPRECRTASWLCIPRRPRAGPRQCLSNPATRNWFEVASIAAGEIAAGLRRGLSGNLQLKHLWVAMILIAAHLNVNADELVMASVALRVGCGERVVRPSGSGPPLRKRRISSARDPWVPRKGTCSYGPDLVDLDANEQSASRRATLTSSDRPPQTAPRLDNPSSCGRPRSAVNHWAKSSVVTQFESYDP